MNSETFLETLLKKHFLSLKFRKGKNTGSDWYTPCSNIQTKPVAYQDNIKITGSAVWVSK